MYIDQLIRHNLWQARWVVGSFCLGSLWVQHVYTSHLLKHDVFGVDGNGGEMLKIITALTDEEMARLKYVRRLYWHWKGSRKYFDGKEQISDQELSDRGIKVEEEPYIEYVKRPPHDKYL